MKKENAEMWYNQGYEDCDNEYANSFENHWEGEEEDLSDFKKNRREIMNAIHHYWDSKGYIRNEQLFAFINAVVKYKKDPFQEEKYLKAFAKNVIIMRDALIDNNEKQSWINGFTIKNEIFDEIYRKEYQRLKSLIGKKESRKRCQNCGVKCDRETILFDNQEIEFNGNNRTVNLTSAHRLIKGNLYLKWNCPDCGWCYADIESNPIQW